jgi:hypothetical protein
LGSLFLGSLLMECVRFGAIESSVGLLQLCWGCWVCRLRAGPVKGQLLASGCIHSEASFLCVLGDREWGAEREGYASIWNSPSHREGRWIIILVLVLGGVLEKFYGCHHCPVRSLLLIFFGVVFSTPPGVHVIDKSCPWIVRWLQERMAQNKEHRYKMEAGIPSFSLLLFNSRAHGRSQCFLAKAV